MNILEEIIKKLKKLILTKITPLNDIKKLITKKF